MHSLNVVHTLNRVNNRSELSQ